MMRSESASVVCPPNIIVPRQSGETRTPVRPSKRYSTAISNLVLASLSRAERSRFHDFLLGGFAATERRSQSAFRKDKNSVANSQQLRQLARCHDDADPLLDQTVDQPIQLGFCPHVD